MKTSLVCHYYRDGPASFSEFYTYIYTRWDLHWWWSRYSLRNLWCPDPLDNCFNTNYLHVLFPKDTGIVVSYPGCTPVLCLGAQLTGPWISTCTREGQHCPNQWSVADLAWCENLRKQNVLHQREETGPGRSP